MTSDCRPRSLRFLFVGRRTTEYGYEPVPNVSVATVTLAPEVENSSARIRDTVSIPPTLG